MFRKAVFHYPIHLYAHITAPCSELSELCFDALSQPLDFKLRLRFEITRSADPAVQTVICLFCDASLLRSVMRIVSRIVMSSLKAAPAAAKLQACGVELPSSIVLDRILRVEQVI